MRTGSVVLHGGAALAAALWTLPAAAAGGAIGVQETQVPVAGISCQRTTPLQPVAPSTEVMSVIDGAYRLSNGRRLDLSSLDQRLVADFGRAREVPLVAVAPDRFESSDGTVKLSYQARGREEWIVVSYPADSRGRYVDVC